MVLSPTGPCISEWLPLVAGRTSTPVGTIGSPDEIRIWRTVLVIPQARQPDDKTDEVKKKRRWFSPRQQAGSIV